MFAATSYWDGFADFWLGSLRQANGVVLLVLGVGLVALIIITSGKWVK